DLSLIDVLGPLTPIYINVSNFLVHPYLAYSWQIPDMVRQEKEIDEICPFPLTAFANPESRQETQIVIASGIRLNHVPCFNINGQIIWGATAMIMNEFLEILNRV
ncbi:MAG: CoA pyrophosphatase, partial [Saprospiraceae bacterium]